MFSNQYDANYSYNQILKMLKDMPHEFLMGLLVVLIIMAVVVVALAVLLYLFSAIGLSRMAKKRGMSHTFLAFIPIVNVYYLGKLADHINTSKAKRTNYRIILLIFAIILEFTSAVYIACYLKAMFFGPSAGILWNVFAISTPLVYVLSLVYVVFYAVALYDIFEEYSPRCAVAFLILSILFSWLAPIFIFALRNKVGITQQPKYLYQQPVCS